MSLSNSSIEIQRLRAAFEAEASKFHELELSTVFVTQDGVNTVGKFKSPNHGIMLWQYYGAIGNDEDTHRLFTNIQESEMKWGLRGAELTSFAVLEGSACQLFVRMAQRAGSLFDKEEVSTIKSRLIEDIVQNQLPQQPSSKPTAVTNDNPLAIWINYLLYHLSMTHPGRERARKIEPDPFALSLLALERLSDEPRVAKVDRSIRKVDEISFRVAMSFPGERRGYVADVVNALRPTLGSDSVFYDYDYKAQLARPNLDTLLQDIYRNNCALIVVFLSAKYAQKEWCGLEWRAIRDIIKSKEDSRVMPIRFDDAKIEGLLSIDGYIDARTHTASAVAELILHRLALLS